MSSNFDYPFQSGTESLPTEPNQRLGGVRPSGNEVNDEYYQEVVERNSSLIDMFVRQSRQEANLSGLDSYYNSGQYPEFDINFIRQFGKEHVNVSPKPKRPKEDKKKEEEIIEDIMLDGYIGVIFNAVDAIEFPTSEVTDHLIAFNKVWVYIPNYTPPGGYTPNFDFLVEVPSYDGITYGIMDFNVWYPDALLNWVTYEPTVEGNITWVGPDDKQYVLKNGNFPHVFSPLSGQEYNIFVKISDFPLQFYKLTTGTHAIPAIGPTFHNKVAIQVALNGEIILNYTPTKMETNCFIFRFGENACRSHSYRDQLTEEFGVKLLNPIIPPRADPNEIFKELLPANCGLDPDFWHGHFQVYDNYNGAGVIPIDIIDAGVFSLDLINTGLNQVTVTYGNPPQTTTYQTPIIPTGGFNINERLDPVGQISVFAEFFSRNPEDYRLVDQSWKNPFKENTKYLVNDLPKYFFPNANLYTIEITNDVIAEYMTIHVAPSNVVVSAQPNILGIKRYLFNKKTPGASNLKPSSQPRPEVYSSYSDFTFEFDLSSTKKDKILATQNLPDGYNETNLVFTSQRVDMIYQPFPIGLQPTVNHNTGDNLAFPFGLASIGTVSYWGGMAGNSWNSGYGIASWYEPEVENGVSDWLLFVRSLMTPYVINGDMSIAGPQEEEKFLKE